YISPSHLVRDGGTVTGRKEKRTQQENQGLLFDIIRRSEKGDNEITAFDSPSVVDAAVNGERIERKSGFWLNSVLNQEIKSVAVNGFLVMNQEMGSVQNRVLIGDKMGGSGMELQLQVTCWYCADVELVEMLLLCVGSRRNLDLELQGTTEW
ncbi:hypothetical protein C5167_046424, partial [Papaver somniferum]